MTNQATRSDDPLDEARSQWGELNEMLTKAQQAYYGADAPVMSDEAYDEALRRLQGLEREHPELVGPDSVTQRVGAATITDFAPVVRDLGLQSSMATMIGVEVTPFDYGHQNAFPVTVRDGPGGGPSLRCVAGSTGQLSDRQPGCGCLHP